MGRSDLHPREGVREFPERRIFVRRPGKTERANAADIRALTARALTRATRGLALALETDGDVTVCPVDIGDEAARWWLEREREGWTQAYRRKAETLGHGRRIINPMFPSPATFHKELAAYLAQAADKFGIRARLEALKPGVGVVRPAIVKLGDDNYSQVEVLVRLSARISAFFDEDDVLGDRELADPPNLSSSLAYIPRIAPVRIPGAPGAVWLPQDCRGADRAPLPASERPSIPKARPRPGHLIADATPRARNSRAHGSLPHRT